MELSYKNIIAQTKELIFNSDEFWKRKSTCKEGVREVLVMYLLPVLLVAAIAVFIGEFFRRTDFFIEYPLLKALREVLLFVLQYYVGIFFTTELMKTYGGEKDKEAARKLVGYSFVPFMLASIVTGLFEFLYVLDILGLYGFYLFWQGAKVLVKLPEHKAHSYIVITIVVNFFTFSFFSWFLGRLLEFIIIYL